MNRATEFAAVRILMTHRPNTDLLGFKIGGMLALLLITYLRTFVRIGLISGCLEKLSYLATELGVPIEQRISNATWMRQRFA